MDFHLDEEVLNFEDPPPEVFHAREEPTPNRFTIKQLESLVNEFIISSNNGLIKGEYFVDLMISRTRNCLKFSDENGIPEIWKNYRRGDYEKIPKSFDLTLTGYVSLKKVSITMCLMSSTIPTDNDIESYRIALTESSEQIDEDGAPLISKDHFIETPAWFDKSEKNSDRPNSHAFMRLSSLKSILFDTVKGDNNLLNIKEYLSLLTIKVPGKEIKIYSDVLSS